MVCLFEEQMLEIEDVAGDVEGNDLPTAIGRKLASRRKALNQQAAFAGHVTVADKILARPDLGQPMGQGEDCALVLFVDRGQLAQLANKG